MDVVIGRIPPTGGPSDKSDSSRGQIEARVLHVRSPRRPNRRGGGDGADSAERRDGAATTTDPAGARVLVLLVPDAHRLPEDLADGQYRLFLRVVRK